MILSLTACGMRADLHQADLPPKGPARVINCNRRDGTVIRMTVSATADAVRLALHDLMANPLLADQPQGLRSTAEIVLAEVLNNIVEHAYAQKKGQITLLIDQAAQGLRCEITDSGLPMPGLRLPDGNPPTLAEIADLPEGGFGWFMIRSLAEELNYIHINGQNRLSFWLSCARSGNS